MENENGTDANRTPGDYFESIKTLIRKHTDATELQEYWSETFEVHKAALDKKTLQALRQHARDHFSTIGGAGNLADPPAGDRITSAPPDVEEYEEEQEEVPVAVAGDEREALANKQNDAQLELEHMEAQRAQRRAEMNKEVKDQKALVISLAHQYRDGITYQKRLVRVRKDFVHLKIEKMYADTGEMVPGYPKAMEGDELQRTMVPSV